MNEGWAAELAQRQTQNRQNDECDPKDNGCNKEPAFQAPLSAIEGCFASSEDRAHTAAFLLEEDGDHEEDGDNDLRVR